MGTRIVLADDHGVTRQGLRSLLEESGVYEVVGEAADGWEALQRVRELRPDIVVADISMPHLNGIDATREIRRVSPQTRVIALSVHSDHAFVADMLKAGAAGYVLKECLFHELTEAIEAVVTGGTYLSPKVAGLVVSEYVRQLEDHAHSPLDDLDTHQRQVLQLIAEGHNTKQIAQCLHLSRKAVEARRRKIMAILDVKSVAELVKVALAGGLTTLD